MHRKELPAEQEGKPCQCAERLSSVYNSSSPLPVMFIYTQSTPAAYNQKKFASSVVDLMLCSELVRFPDSYFSAYYEINFYMREFTVLFQHWAVPH